MLRLNTTPTSGTAYLTYSCMGLTITISGSPKFLYGLCLQAELLAFHFPFIFDKVFKPVIERNKTIEHSLNCTTQELSSRLC